MPIAFSDHDPASLFQILLDRQSALDIGAFVVGGIDVSPGEAIPSDGDGRIDHALAGFLFTCGPDHIRHPEPVEGADDGRTFPLHGSLCGTPVTWTDMSEDQAEPACRAGTDVSLADGGQARIERLWSVDRDGQAVTLRDLVVNTGETPIAPMMMYHINLGARLFDARTRIVGDMLPGGGLPWRFGEGDSSVACMPAGDGDDAGFAAVSVGPIAAIGSRFLRVRFRTSCLPFLQMWRCQRDGADVFSLEPASHRLARRTELAEGGEMPLLQPGETAAYELAFQAV